MKITRILTDIATNFSAMNDTAETARKSIAVLNGIIPGFAATGAALALGCPAVPVLLFAAVTALGVAGILKEARDDAARDRILAEIKNEVRAPFNAARKILLEQWPGTPEFDDLSQDWVGTLARVTQDEADRVIRDLTQTNQKFWNWFADYFKPQLDALRKEVGQIDALPLVTPEPIEENEYYYAGDQNEIVGRGAEQSYLESFLADKKPVSWALMVGSAGSGKSRLGLWAVEKAKELGYRAGFLNPGTEFGDWSHFIVREDTFVVIDYALRRPGNLKTALEGLIGKREGRRLRVLVLERAPLGQWWSELGAVRDRYEPSEDGAQGSTGEPHLDLGTMSRAGARELFGLLGAKGMPEGWTAERLEAALTQADPKRRPLFARFLFKAVVEGAYQANWTAKELAKHVLDHELKQRWEQAHVDTPHANLAFAACALKGVNVQVLDQVPCLEDLVPRRGGRDAKKCQAVAALGGGFDPQNGDVPAHEPDTLAEFYILERLMGRAQVDQAELQAQQAKEVLDCLWAQEGGSPEALIDLVQRASRSFPTHDGLSLLQQVPESVPEEARARALGQSLVAQADAAETAEEKQAAASGLADAAKGPGEAGRLLRLLQAQSLFKATLGRETTKEGQAALAGLRALADDHPDEPEMRLELAKALFNARLGRETTKVGQAALAVLRTLADEHPDEPEVRLVLAKALTNAVAELKEDGPRQAALAELRALADDHPDEPEVRLELAKALFNATLGRETTKEGQAALAGLRSLADEHPDEPEVRLRLAKALTNAVLKLAKDGPRQDALAGLRALADEHRDEPEVRLELAKALTNAVIKLEKDGPRQAALANLRTLADEHPDEPQMRQRFAEALNIMAYHRLHSPAGLGGAAPFLAEARALAEGHEADPDWAETFAFLSQFPS